MGFCAGNRSRGRLRPNEKHKEEEKDIYSPRGFPDKEGGDTTTSATGEDISCPIRSQLNAGATEGPSVD